MGKVIGFSCLGLIALVVVLVIALMAAGGDDDEPDRTPTGPATRATERERPEDESGARGDVRITACAVDPATKWPSAELLITNRSSKASNYIVEVEFVDASNKRLGEALATSSGVAPEQRSEVRAQGLTQVSAKITCRITDVTRTAS
ncbi:FxLYD domain-containing protein [Streptomyces sp. SBC-4]|nr:FxLYD domain-containing protein [Streptomyces sp. SBC-4]MDV5145905.1 FxLYD domain-containing protein [Streptomyces sp. SBC-4]